MGEQAADAALESPAQERSRQQRRYARARPGLFAAGFATYGLLYCTQPLLPAFSESFGVSPAESALTLSLATQSMAVCMLIAGALSESWGRRWMMIGSMGIAAIVTLLAALLPGWHTLLALRAVTGMALAGVPPVIAAYLTEEFAVIAPGAMGLLITGNSTGGMVGRLLSGALTDLFSWRAALGGMSVLCMIGTFLVMLLPKSENFRRRDASVSTSLRAFAAHLRDPVLLALFGIGYLGISCFIIFYNYVTYRLVAPPYSLSQAVMSGIFLIYLIGMVAANSIGRLVTRYGRVKPLAFFGLITLAGVPVSLIETLPTIILGQALVTFGFFGTHTLCSAWVGLRGHKARAQASAIYLFCFYTGFSFAGWAGGLAWTGAGWNGVALMMAAHVIAALFLVAALPRLERNRPLQAD